jgi:hypothetical protein
MRLEHGLVPARDEARWVSAQVSKLDDEACKAGACPRGVSAQTARSWNILSMIASGDPASRSPKLRKAANARACCASSTSARSLSLLSK